MTNEFKQYELETVQAPSSTTQEVGGGSVVKDGFIQSPNFVHLKKGWSIDSEGNAEFQSLIVAGQFVETSVGTFGGDGSDGDLIITSGTTTIDLGNAAYFVKNYLSLSITGTGAIQFINPHTNGTTIVIKVQGDVTLTSSATPMIDASGCGGAGGAAVSTSTGADVNGNPGNAGSSSAVFNTSFGAGGNRTGNSLGGALPTALSISSAKFGSIALTAKYGALWPGAGGGSGAAYGVASGTNTSGAGGNGGGCLIIECAGAWNFTTTNGISVAGKNGSNASSVGGANTSVAGGGGGSGGYFIGLYNTLTANSGTVNVAGGTGGTSLSAGSGSGTLSGGAGGASAINAGNNSTGVAPPSYPTGGTGGNGTSLITMNTSFA